MQNKNMIPPSVRMGVAKRDVEENQFVTTVDVKLSPEALVASSELAKEYEEMQRANLHASILQDATNAALKLIHIGRCDAAFRVLDAVLELIQTRHQDGRTLMLRALDELFREHTSVTLWCNWRWWEQTAALLRKTVWTTALHRELALSLADKIKKRAGLYAHSETKRRVKRSPRVPAKA